MPRLNTACADCGKKITGKDFESGMALVAYREQMVSEVRDAVDL